MALAWHGQSREKGGEKTERGGKREGGSYSCMCTWRERKGMGVMRCWKGEREAEIIIDL